MPNTTPTTNHCPKCDAGYAADVLVCPRCQTILLTPGVESRRKTPRWFIVLLLVIIAALASYAGYLAYQVLVLHRF